MAGPKKYIFVNGVMMKNPEYVKADPASAGKKPDVAVEKQLAVVCSPSDQDDAKQQYDEQVNPEDSKDKQFTFETANGIASAMTLMSSPEYVMHMGQPPVEQKSLFDH